MKFDEFFQRKLIAEAHVVKFNTRNKFVYPEEQVPLKDNMTIRVYHGFNNMIDCIRTLKYGLSGKEDTDRRYSYESNNNPKGLFITINPAVAKEFGNWIIEFHAKVSDLEAPVWPGGSYTVQGQMAQYFNDDNDREQQRLKVRERESKNEYPSISKSDRPELARILYFSSEQQALFTGELNHNSVRGVWVNETPDKSGKYSSYKRISSIEFLKLYGNKDKVTKRDWKSGEYRQEDDDTELKGRVLRPRDKFDMKTFLHKMEHEHNSISGQDLIDALKTLHKGQLLHYVWPSQVDDLMNQLQQMP